MDHSAIKEKLDAYLDRELPGTETEEIRDHLKSCAACSDVVSDWAKLRGVFFTPETVKPSEAFVIRVMEAIRLKNKFNLFTFFEWAFPTFALMVAFLFVTSIWFTNESVAYETSVLKAGSPLTIQEMAMDAGSDWTGVEIL